jgi:putative addiction module component (TIGR02574 family)
VALMASPPSKSDLEQLSVADRLQLMDEIWESLAPHPATIPMPDWHVAENQRRIAALEADGLRGRAASEVFADLKQKL